MNFNFFLTFSDAAKFADLARNLVNGLGYVSSFTTWEDTVFTFIRQNLLFSPLFPPVVPFSMAAFFKIFGTGAFAVIATSFFYFILILIFVFLLARKIFKSNLVGILSTIAVGFNYDLINYATSGASESTFIFEIVAAAYFISLRKKWGTLFAFSLLVLMYFTRAQAIIYILGLLVYYLFQNFSWKKATVYSFGLSVLGLMVYIMFSTQGVIAITQSMPGIASSELLRGGTQAVSFLTLLKKLFYNLYNFYKLLPQIINPYLFALFIVGLFKWTDDKKQTSFKVGSIFMVLATILVTAITIPLFRYIHPIIPLVYIIAIGTLVWVVAQLFKGKSLAIVTFSLVLFFAVGQTLGVFLLDSRFERNTHNVGKPPVYVQLSYLLRDNTSKDELILTNLDTWGSWYGERKTVWFPLEPKRIIDPATGKIPFDAIYLTSYLMDDENYYMGKDWRMIFDNPSDSKKWTCDGCVEIAKEFKLKDIYSVPAAGDYERQDAKAILLIKK